MIIELNGILTDKIQDLTIKKEINRLDVLSFRGPKGVIENSALESKVKFDGVSYIIKENSGGTVRAVLDVNDLRSQYIESKILTALKINDNMGLLLDGTGWSAQGINSEDRRAFTFNNVNTYDAIKEMAEKYDFEIRFDTVNKIVHYAPTLGSDKGVYFAEELNLDLYDVEEESYEFATRIEARGKDGMTFASLNDGKSYLDNFEYSDEVITFYWEDNRYTNKENLMTDAWSKLLKLSRPKKTYTIEVKDLASISEKYSILEFDIGDTVRIIGKSEEEHRIVSITKNLSNPAENTCVLSNKKTSLFDENKLLKEEVKEGFSRTEEHIAILDGEISLKVSREEVYTEIEDYIEENRESLKGKDADQWTIGVDGFWYKNGVKTSDRAIPIDGSDGDNWEIGADGFWYKNGVKTNKYSKGDKGETGEPGKDGAKGADGTSQYTHIRYSANANGNPMTTTPNANTKYIGIAVTTSSTSPSGYASYSWAKFVGEDGEDGQDGIPGKPGADGITYYTWIRYADSPTTGMSNSPSGKAYIGIAYNKTTATESSVYSDYSWSLIKGDKGDQGIPGEDGTDGISIISAKRQFYLSTSSTTQTGGSWSDTQPAWVSGKHLWTRLYTTYSDGSTQATGVALDKDWVALTDMNIELGRISSDGYITKAGRAQLIIKVKSMESDYAGLEEYLGLWADYEIIYNDVMGYLEDIISAETDIVQVDPEVFKEKIEDYEEALVEMKRLVREHEGQRIFELESRLSSAELEITDESILQKVTSSEVFVSKEAYDDNTGAIQDRLEYLENTTSTFETTISGWEASVSTRIEDALGAFEDEFHDYIRWADGKLYLGKSTSEISLVQQHDRISFMQGDFELAYFSDGQLVVNEIATEILNMKGYSIKAVGDNLEGWYHG